MRGRGVAAAGRVSVRGAPRLGGGALGAKRQGRVALATYGVDPPPMLLMLAFFTQADKPAPRAWLSFEQFAPTAANGSFSSRATEQ